MDRETAPREGGTAGRGGGSWLRRDPAVLIKLALAVVAALTMIGAVALWPRGEAEKPWYSGYPEGEGPANPIYVDATIGAVDESARCPYVAEDTVPCTLYGVRLTSGADRGNVVVFAVHPHDRGVPELSSGDRVVLREWPTVEGVDGWAFRYEFVDFQRSTPMLWLLGLFVVVVVAFGRWHGVRALAGLGATLLVVGVFLVPALLRGSPVLWVALVGAALVAFVSFFVTHGAGLHSSVALAGTLLSLGITAVLAMVVVFLTRLTGLATDEAQFLQVTGSALDLRGLLVAGIVIGTLGVLDDVTVSQVSTVTALRRANPALPAVRLYREAIRVGRDHVAAAVNTLVLAYAGAALPLLLLVSQGPDPLSRVLTSELVAVEVVRMLVGSIGLVLSVPITTGLAAAVFGRDDDEERSEPEPDPEGESDPGVEPEGGLEPSGLPLHSAATGECW